MWGQGLVIFSFVVRLTCFIELVCHCHTCTSEPCENLQMLEKQTLLKAFLVTEGVSAEVQLLKAISSHCWRWGTFGSAGDQRGYCRVDIDGRGYFEARNIRKWTNIWSRLYIEHMCTQIHSNTWSVTYGMYTHRNMTREKRETLKLVVHKPDLSKCVNTVRNRKHGLTAQFHMVANYLKQLLFYCFHIVNRIIYIVC